MEQILCKFSTNNRSRRRRERYLSTGWVAEFSDGCVTNATLLGYRMWFDRLEPSEDMGQQEHKPRTAIAIITSGADGVRIPVKRGYGVALLHTKA